MWINIGIGVLLTLNVVVCLLLILAVLMQRSKQDGLGAAFGGGMTQDVFGAQTSSVLVKFTTILAGAFFVLTMALAYLYAQRTPTETALSRKLKQAPAGQVAPTNSGVVTQEIPVEGAKTPAAEETPQPTSPPASSPAPAPEPAQKP